MTSSPSPIDRLATVRTHLANERTLLAYIRTALGFAAGGIGVKPEKKLIPPTPMGDHPLMDWGVFPHNDEDKGDYQVASFAVDQIKAAKKTIGKIQDSKKKKKGRLIGKQRKKISKLTQQIKRIDSEN